MMKKGAATIRGAVLGLAVWAAVLAIPACEYGAPYTATREYDPPAIALAAPELFRAYADPAAGEARFGGQLVRVRGLVDLKTIDEADSPVLLLRGGTEPEAQGVLCAFADRYRDQARLVELGQEVTVQGIVRFRRGNVILEKCSFPPESRPTTVERRAVYPSRG